MCFGIFDAYRAALSSSWPHAQGVMRTSRVATSTDSDGQHSNAVLGYEFQVGGRGYTGTGRMGWGEFHGFGIGRPDDVVQLYPVGSAVTVYYDPRNPSDCRLEPGLHWSHLGLPVFGMAFMAIPALIVYLPHRRWKREADRIKVTTPEGGPVEWPLLPEATEAGASAAAVANLPLIAAPAPAVVGTTEDGRRVAMRFQGGRAAFAPGETMAVQVDIDPATAAALTSLDIEYGWQTEGTGTEDKEVVHHAAFPVKERALTGRLTFKSPPLPPSPWSYEGKLLTIRWCVSLKLGVPGRPRRLGVDLPFVLRGDPRRPVGPSLASDGWPSVPKVQSKTRPGPILPHRLHPDIQTGLTGSAIAVSVIALASSIIVLAASFIIQIDWLRYVVFPLIASGWVLWLLFLYVRSWFVGETSIELGHYPLRPGVSTRLAVSQSGRMMLLDLGVTLRGVEVVKYGEGTNTSTDTHTFYEKQIIACEDWVIVAGDPLVLKGTLSIPGDAMHSFEAKHNQIRWRLWVEGNAEVWNHFDRGFTLLVTPETRALKKPSKAERLES